MWNKYFSRCRYICFCRDLIPLFLVLSISHFLLMMIIVMYLLLSIGCFLFIKSKWFLRKCQSELVFFLRFIFKIMAHLKNVFSSFNIKCLLTDNHYGDKNTILLVISNCFTLSNQVRHARTVTCRAESIWFDFWTKLHLYCFEIVWRI